MEAKDFADQDARVGDALSMMPFLDSRTRKNAMIRIQLSIDAAAAMSVTTLQNFGVVCVCTGEIHHIGICLLLFPANRAPAFVRIGLLRLLLFVNSMFLSTCGSSCREIMDRQAV
jgi:hypothetical protein